MVTCAVVFVNTRRMRVQVVLHFKNLYQTCHLKIVCNKLEWLHICFSTKHIFATSRAAESLNQFTLDNKTPVKKLAQDLSEQEGGYPQILLLPMILRATSR